LLRKDQKITDVFFGIGGAVCLSGEYQTQRGIDMTGKCIDVYMGFMDEEVNTVLASLIRREEAKEDASSRRPVILIERGEVKKEDAILEWPISRYGIDKNQKTGKDGEVRDIRVLHVDDKTIDSRKVTLTEEDASPEGILRRAFAVFLERDDVNEEEWRKAGEAVLRMFDRKKMLSLRSGKEVKMPLKSDKSWFSIIRFPVGNDADKQPPIIVFRVPEMGLQPSLMSPYMEFVLMMISALSGTLAQSAKKDADERKDVEEWPLRLICFGAQGGASSKNAPGSLSPVCASLYVGNEFLDNEVTPSIALCSQDAIYHFNAGTPLKSGGLAEYFNKNHDKLRVDRIECDPAYRRAEEKCIDVGMGIGQVISLLVENYSSSGKCQAEVTGTSNWFISADQKEAFSKIGITGCNMEDYWVLRSMRRCALERVKSAPRDRSMYPVFERGFLTRVNVDPLVIEPEMLRAFDEDVRKKRLSREQYVDLLLWGLEGLPMKSDGDVVMPKVARWTLAEKARSLGDGVFRRHLYGLLVNDPEKFVVPDPFFIEIATDLLKSCVASVNKEKDPPEASGGVVFATPPGNEEIFALHDAAEAVFKAWNGAGQQPTEFVRAAVRTFVDTLIESAGFGDTTADGVKVWLRPRKWENITVNSIQDLSGEVTFTAAAVDRAFYKSSNLIALQENTRRVLR
jgi:hypothetical protein